MSKNTPPIDTQPTLLSGGQYILGRSLESIPPLDTPWQATIWPHIAALGDEFAANCNSLFSGARGFSLAWRSTRSPTSLLPSGLRPFEGMFGPGVLSFLASMAHFGAVPRSDVPPARSANKSYSSVGENYTHAIHDMWGSNQWPPLSSRRPVWSLVRGHYRNSDRIHSTQGHRQTGGVE